MLRRHKIYEPSGCERSFLDAFQLRFNTSFLTCFTSAPSCSTDSLQVRKIDGLLSNVEGRIYLNLLEDCAKADVRVKP